MAQPVRWTDSVENLRAPHEARPFGCQQHAAKIFSVVIALEARIPRPSSFCQFPARKPGRGLHVQVVAHFPQEPLDRDQIMPEQCRYEPCAVRSVIKRGPRTGEKYSSIVFFSEF